MIDVIIQKKEEHDFVERNLIFDAVEKTLVDSGGFRVKTEVYGSKAVDPMTRLKFDAVNIFYHTAIRHKICINVKMSYLRDFYYFDNSGYSGWSYAAEISDLSSLASDLDYSRLDFIKKEFIDKRKTKYDQDEDGFNVDEPYIALFMQKDGDSVLSLSRFIAEDIVRMSCWAADELGVKLVIKKHPLCKSEGMDSIISVFSGHPNVVVTSANIHSILENASMAMCVNSGVGFEALLQSKKVALFGESDYAAACYKIRKKEDIVSAYHAMEKDRRKVDRFLSWFLFDYNVNLITDVGLAKIPSAVMQKNKFGVISHGHP